MRFDPRLLGLLAGLLTLILVARRFRYLHEVERIVPPSWILPAVVGIVTAGLTAWIWGGFHAPAVLHDEAAYLLQAGLFARGRWVLAEPVVPAAFAQPAVLVTPLLTPKMFPGHAFVLIPGVLLGLPGLVPVLLAGLTGAMVVIIARRLAGSGVALLTLAIWLTQAGQWRWRSSYLSESTTAALWLVAWWFLLRWREERKPGWLLAIAGAAGLGAITRPITMLAWLIPVGVVVVHDIVREGRWRQLIWAAGVGTAVLLGVPLQNHAALGDWRRSPLSLYTQQYMPFDRMGFGLDSTPPSLGLPQDLQPAMAGFVERHRAHSLAALPGILVARLDMLRRQVTGQWRIVWLPAFLLGLVLLRSPGWFGLVTGLALYAAYLLYAHESHWTAYYAEMTPTVAFPIAVGLAWILARLVRSPGLPLSLAATVGLIILGAGAQEIAASRAARGAEQAPLRKFRQIVASRHAGQALVFVRPDPEADPHLTLIRNVADPDGAEIVTARDMGDAINRVVAAAYPTRAPFLWDQRTAHLSPLQFGPTTP